MAISPKSHESAHATADLAPEETEALLEATRGVLGAVGFGTGFVHCEWIVCDATPYLVECAGRMPGDGIMELIQHAWQFEVAQLYIAGMEGRPAPGDLPRQPGRGAAVWFLHVEPGEVLRVEGVEEAKAVPDVVTVSVTAEPGGQVHELRSSWDRVALVTACSLDTSEALRRAKQGIEAITVKVLPLSA